jgi:hypothetical protein
MFFRSENGNVIFMSKKKRIFLGSLELFLIAFMFIVMIVSRGNPILFIFSVIAFLYALGLIISPRSRFYSSLPEKN